MAQESKFDDDEEDGDGEELFADELVDTVLEAFEQRQEKARGRIDFRRMVEQKLELKHLRDELGLYTISEKDSDSEIC
mgnify:CR=1 FL=1